MLIETLSGGLRKAHSVNQTSSSFVDKLPTISNPFIAANANLSGDAATATGASIIKAGYGGGVAQNALKILPYGSGSDTNTFSFQVWAWEHTIGTDPSKSLWVATLLCECLATISSSVPGVAGADCVNTEYFANTISVTYGNGNVSVEVVSPAATKRATSAIVDVKGAELIEIAFSTGSSATDCNALWKFL